MTELMLVPVHPVEVQVREDRTDDAQVIGLWLHGRPPTTRKAYWFEIGRFLDYVVKPLGQITLGDLQGYIDTLAGLATASRARAINAIKSLFSFSQKTGYLEYNVAAAVHAPKVKNTLSRVSRTFTRKCTLRKQTKVSPSFHPIHIRHTG